MARSKPKFKRDPDSYSTEEIAEWRRRAETVGMRVVWIDSRKPFLVRTTRQGKDERWILMDEMELMNEIVTKRMDSQSRASL